MGLQIDRFHFLVAYLAPFLMFVRVEFAFHFEPRAGFRRTDEIDDRLIRAQWLTPPVDGNEGEQAMFDLVPLARSGWEVTHGERDPHLVG